MDQPLYFIFTGSTPLEVFKTQQECDRFFEDLWDQESHAYRVLELTRNDLPHHAGALKLADEAGLLNPEDDADD